MSLNPRLTHWSGRTAWLIGASTGIGRATAARLHALGAKVVVSARSASALQAFTEAHVGSEALALDATDRDALHAAAAGIVERHGRIDLAVYCAGTRVAGSKCASQGSGRTPRMRSATIRGDQNKSL